MIRPVIIKEEALLVAKMILYRSHLRLEQLGKYTKHDYAIFNPIHTWVEYINRLLGALAGIACIITFILSFGYRKKTKTTYLLDLCFNGFSSLVGKTVVDSVLNPFKITTHMLAALLIVALQLIVIYTVKNTEQNTYFQSKV
jgi:cytochrome c oxidase assembly protein subunit 15